MSKKVKDEVKESKELCAISKEFAAKQLQKLIEDNKEIFDEYVMWQNVLSSEVKITETKEDEPEQTSE